MISRALLAGILVAAVASPALCADPAAWQAYQSGRAALQAENYAEAEKRFRVAISLDRLLSVAHYGLGEVFMMTRSYAEAAQAFEAAIAAHRDAVSQGASEAAKADQRRDERIREFRDAIRQLETGQIKTSPHEVTRLEQMIQQIEREKGLERMAMSEPPAEFFLALGSARFRAGALPEARQAYLEAIRVKPGFGDAHNNLAALALQMGDRVAAREHLREAEKAGFPVSRRMKADIEGTAVTEAAPIAGAPPVIRHEPLRCAVAGTFPEVEARVSSSARIARARVKFRGTDSNYWYAVAMRAEGDRFVAALPKTRRDLGSFHYVVDVVDEAALASHTEEYEVKVAADAADCTSTGARSVASIVVDIPPGAPARPPVPKGFSASRVKGVGGTAAGIFYLPPRVAAAIGVTVVAAGATAAAAVLYDDPPSNQIAPPEVVVVRGEPPLGSNVSLSRDRLILSLRVTLRRNMGGGTFSLSLHGPAYSCFLINGGTHGPIPAETPTELTVEALLSTSFCRAAAVIDRGTINISENFEQVGQTAFIEFPIAYTFVP
jgi:tetratricopeptide (TPR) repeat protein